MGQAKYSLSTLSRVDAKGVRGLCASPRQSMGKAVYQAVCTTQGHSGEMS